MKKTHRFYTLVAAEAAAADNTRTFVARVVASAVGNSHTSVAAAASGWV